MNCLRNGGLTNGAFPLNKREIDSKEYDHDKYSQTELKLKKEYEDFLVNYYKKVKPENIVFDFLKR